MAIVMDLLGCCLRGLEDILKISPKQGPSISDQKRAILRIVQHGKGEGYYIAIRNIVSDAIGQSLTVNELGFEEAIHSDALIFQNIINHKNAKNIPLLKEEIKRALERGVPAKVLQDLVGPQIRVETLTQKSKNQAFEQYIALLSAECSVCCEEYSPADFVGKKIARLSCHHFYHKACVEQALSYKAECPVCRVDISTASHQQEQKAWNTLLLSINKEIKERFPDEEEDNLADKPVDPDELLARTIQSEEDAAADKERAEAEDARIALGIALGEYNSTL